MAIGNRQSEILLGTRASKLACQQAHGVGRALVQGHSRLTYRLVHIKTTGDRRATEHLPSIGGKGLFTRELEEALLDGRIDLAVHSLKDLPTQLPDELTIAALPERAPANDVLISADGRPLAELPPGARIGTSSPRRAAQLLHARPDLRPVPIRGNLDTRLRKLREGQADAICVALAGLVRLGLAEEASEVLPFDLMLPAPGQGALAVEMPRVAANADSNSRTDLAELVSAVHHRATATAATAERALLQALGGGCSLPFGAYAERTGPHTLRLRAVLLTPDGKAAARADRTGPADDPEAIAHAAAADLRADGADAILQALNAQ